MGRFILFIFGLAVLGAAAYFGLGGIDRGEPATASPPEQLQHVREKAKKIEVDWQERADDTRLPE